MKTHVHRNTTKDSRQCCRIWIQDCRDWVFPRLAGTRLAGTLICVALTVLVGRADVFGDETVSFETLDVHFARDVRPLLKQFCLECHSTKQQEGDLDLQRFATLAQVRRETKVWLKVAEMLDNGEMPPEDEKQPTPKQRNQLRGWIEQYLHAEALANAGDPGPVVLRRLDNAEYTYTIRDLTRVDLNPAHEFPTDSAAGEGFTNTGNALVMSPALLKKYLDAGEEIARHAVLLPDGFRFSPRATRRDWTDEILSQIRDFYREFVDSVDLGTGLEVGYINGHPDTRLGHAGRLPLEKYFAATLSERDALTTGGRTIEAVAREHGLNGRYLGTLWSSLSGSGPSLLLDALRARWRGAKPQDAAALAADVITWQKGLWTFSPVGLLGRPGGSSRWLDPVNPLVIHQDLRFKIPASVEGGEQKEVVVSFVATDAGDGNEHDYVVWQQPRLVAKDCPDILLRDLQETGLDPAMFGKHPNGKAIDAASLCVRAPSVIKIRLPAHLVSGRDLLTTAALDEETGREGSVQVDVVAGTPPCKSGLLPSEVTVTFSEVIEVFSEHRNITFSRPILVGKNSAARTTLESAMNEYRDLFPTALCYTQIVPVDELHVTTLFYREDGHLARLMLDDVQKSRLDRLWEELRYVSQGALMRVVVLEDILNASSIAQKGKNSTAFKLLEPLLGPVNEGAVAFRKELVAAEPMHVDVLVDFAARAYRRPLSDAEANQLRGLYRRLREQELPHDEAFRLTLARIFVASPFLFRLEKAPAGTAAATVSDWELASRLSYFLWSSQPDEELRALAAEGTLHASEVLAKQADRMLDDARVRRLATEFACHWLHIHDFDLFAEKSGKHFPEFAELRGDMYEESVRFFTDIFMRDASLLSLLSADHTFVNERLARFYGIEEVQGAAWRRINGMQRHGRGGILGLATTLAKQSGPSRTSPILRGNWVSEVLLGEKLPRPPKDVPLLATTVPAGLTERQLIERHSSDPACAKCHSRIDPFGFALENFDAIGRRREKDASGLAIDSRTTLPDGTKIEGLAGLRDYLLQKRRDVFLSLFCRKLLGYAIGRELQLSDEPLLAEIQQRLARNDYRFSVVVKAIVLSDQFCKIRGREKE